MSIHRDAGLLTDRDERALLAAAEQRISEPLRFAAAVRALRRFARGGKGPRRIAQGTKEPRRFAPGRPRGSAEGRQSLSCRPTPRTPPEPAPTAR
ncbi:MULTISPECIES: hypothetical protein [unclassified Streptomyces]|uniref:hypothetical protein n=1 Tax=unclassified Streptomyces TaxID=2593676 RepID=UPI002E37C74D|nr:MULTISPECIES: hypothetical protein [unclassified Streptomyces]WUC63947.1 hypothetical protein OG861_06705 [Streptomyces sp. NBC_00539]